MLDSGLDHGLEYGLNSNICTKFQQEGENDYCHTTLTSYEFAWWGHGPLGTPPPPPYRSGESYQFGGGHMHKLLSRELWGHHG